MKMRAKIIFTFLVLLMFASATAYGTTVEESERMAVRLAAAGPTTPPPGVKSSTPVGKVPVAAAKGQEIDCLKCHAKLKSGKVVHPALEMGCMACHTGIDAKTVPHKRTNKIVNGLSGGQPDLCYGCHDQEMFTKKDVHPAIGIAGCTGCHNPHSSNNEKMLIAPPPDLCFTCHDKAMFSKKTVHSPVAAGKCLSCHAPHSSDQIALLLKPPVEVCLGCHPDIPKSPHAAAVFSAISHPLGLPKIGAKTIKTGDKGETKVEEVKEPAPMDPSRPDRVFYCGSCHNPHSSSGTNLFRFDETSTMGLCSHCHKI